jgi:hypothetical protein
MTPIRRRLILATLVGVGATRPGRNLMSWVAQTLASGPSLIHTPGRSECGKAGKPFDYVRIKDGDHSLWDNGQRLALLTALEKFLAEHNPTDVLGAAPVPPPAAAGSSAE